jgi:hypothetical protein
MTLTITERVAAGAAYLDEIEPGWVERIDLGKLVLSSPCRCILGQLHGDYWRSPLMAPYRTAYDPDQLAEGDDRSAALGFTVTRDSYDSLQFDALTAEWKRLIEARRVVAL